MSTNQTTSRGSFEPSIHRKAGPPATNLDPEAFRRWIWGLKPRERVGDNFYDPRERQVRFTDSSAAGQLNKLRIPANHACNRIPGMKKACHKCNMHRKLNSLMQNQQKVRDSTVCLELVCTKGNAVNLAKKHMTELAEPISLLVLKKRCAKKFRDFKINTGRIYACFFSPTSQGSSLDMVIEVTREEAEFSRAIAEHRTRLKQAPNQHLRLVLSSKAGWAHKCSTDPLEQKLEKSEHQQQKNANPVQASVMASLDLAEAESNADVVASIAPPTWVLPDDEAALKAYIATDGQKDEDHFMILKPDFGRCGQQIIVDRAQAVLKRWGQELQKEEAVVQLLIQPPLLYKSKYKFEQRVHVVVTSLSPMTAYLQTDGIARICCNQWERCTEGNKGMGQTHVFGATDEHAREAQEAADTPPARLVINDLLEELGADAAAIWRQVHRAVGIVLKAMRPMLLPHLEHTKRLRAFHVLGFDFMVDANQRAWFLEVNEQPSLLTELESDLRVKPSFVTAVLDVVFGGGGDPVASGLFVPVCLD